MDTEKFFSTPDSRNNLLPLYIQIADTIRNQILSGELPPGIRLPTQRDLAAVHKTTLITIRQALDVLEDENLIRTVHGVGTFVDNPSMKEDHFHLLSFGNEMDKRAVKIETRLIQNDSSCRNESASRALGLSAETDLVCFTRQRFYRDQPVVYQRSYLAPILAIGLVDLDITAGLYSEIFNQTGQSITLTREAIRPIVLQKKQAVWLNSSEGDPALLSYRISCNRDGEALIFDEAYLHGDYFVLTTERMARRTSYRINFVPEPSEGWLDLLAGLD